MSDFWIWRLNMNIVDFVMRRLVLRKKINEYYKSVDVNPEIEEIRSYVGKGLYKTFSYEFTKKYMHRKNDILFDDSCQMNYVIHNGKRMYFSKNMSKKAANKYYNQLCMEQDMKSPHNYFKFVNRQKYKTVVDLGAAEGIFSLNIIEKADKVWLFECDDLWIEALKQTFRPYEDKVCIKKMYVGNGTDNSVRLDTVFTANEQIDLVKMDIEGSEYDTISGMSDIIKQNSNMEMLICTYHNQDDESRINELLQDWSFEHSDGYMLFFEDANQKPPYFRRGLIHGVRNR